MFFLSDWCWSSFNNRITKFSSLFYRDGTSQLLPIVHQQMQEQKKGWLWTKIGDTANTVWTGNC